MTIKKFYLKACDTSTNFIVRCSLLVARLRVLYDEQLKTINYQRILLIHFSLFLIPSIKAQDAIYSQFYNTPQLLNPAMTGIFQGSVRANVNYRQQWSGVFSDVAIRTASAGVDYRFHGIADDYIAIGLSGISDNAGGYSDLQTNSGAFAASYLKQLGGDRYSTSSQYLVAGLQVGMAQKKITNNLWYDRQFDPSTYTINTSLSNGEFLPQSNNYTDFNLGLMYYNVIDDNHSIYFGGAVDHINQPKVSFLGNTKEVLRQRLVFHGGGQFPLRDELTVLPSVLVTLQGPSMYSTVQTSFRYTNNDWNELAIRAGGGFRIVNGFVYDPTNKAGGNNLILDALIISMMFEKSHFIFGLSYDIHTSSIVSPTNGRGAWELSLIFVAPEKTRVNTACPKF